MIPTILAILVYGMVSAVLGTLLPDLSRRLSFTEGQNGSIAFVQSLGLIAASLSTGPLIDRKGTKIAVLAGLAVVSVSLFSLASAASFTIVAWAMLCLGLGSGMVTTATNTIASQISPERRASTLNLLNLFFGLGGFLTPIIGAYWFFGNTLQLCYLLAALAAGVLLLHLAVPMPPLSASRGFSFSEAGRLLGNRSLFLISLFLALYVACEASVWNWFAKYLVTQGVPQQTALRTLSLGFALGILLGRLLASRVSFPVLHVMLVCPILMAVTTGLMLQTDNPTAAGLLVFCAGLAMAPVFPTTLGLIGDRFPVLMSTAIGIVITSGWIGLALSSKVIGTLAGADSGQLKTALLVLPALSGIMVVVNLLLRASLREPVVSGGPIPS